MLASSGSALLVEGPAGIGKSALIRAIRAQALSREFLVLSARGAELERDFSFGVVRQLFEPTLASATLADREALLAGAARLAEPAIGDIDAITSTQAAAASTHSPTGSARASAARHPAARGYDISVYIDGHLWDQTIDGRDITTEPRGRRGHHRITVVATDFALHDRFSKTISWNQC